MSTTSVSIVGGGLSGLAAALAVVRDGGRARVYERRGESGARFHGDFQGLENWSTEGDVLEEFASFGIEPTFDHTPFRECVFFDPDGREHVCRSQQPLWYLVRRGTEVGTLDQALKAQALAAGVDIEFGQTVEHLPEGGIVAYGPRRVDAIAVGYVFPTDRADGAFGVVSDTLAPGGYAYLLICRGRATVATCMFDDFHNDKQYLARTVEFFEKSVGLVLQAGRQFGGFANMSPEPRVRRGRVLFAGEAAGLQDALFGFGMRYAVASGHLAGRAFVNGDLSQYEAAYRRQFRPRIQAATVNRYLYRRAGERGYRTLVERLSEAPDPRAWMRRYYNRHWWTPLIYPIARAHAARVRSGPDAHECREAATARICQCVREAAASRTVDDVAKAGRTDRDVPAVAGASPGRGEA